MATVTIKNGPITGTKGTNLVGAEFYRFLGIPYAAPPVGPLRFKAPQPAQDWKGTRDCTKNSSPNLSLDFITGKIIGSEDCLYLNVHTRELPKPGTTPKPVMVFFHGGGFTQGSGTEVSCNPKSMMLEDIVLVTINYRLGIFGFLSLEDPTLEVPGNAALKDQTLALKWVQENISSFNGDPNNVTIFGISAGSASVQFQLLSPTAKGLFHKAIMQSGSLLNSWAWGQRNALLVAEKLGKKVTLEREALDVLMEATAEELYGVALSFPDNLANVSRRRPFGPVVETPNPTAFLTEDPYLLLSKGQFSQVPMIQGLCSEEGLIYNIFVLMGQDPQFQLSERLVNWNLKNKSEKIQERLKELYYKEGHSKDAIIKHCGDATLASGIIQSAQLLLKHAIHPIFFYVQSYEADLCQGFNKFIQLDENAKGFPHGGDTSFFFPSALVTINDEDVEAIKQLVKIWADFAKTGNPHPLWKPLEKGKEMEYLLIDKEMKLLSGPLKERMEVWKKINEEAGGIDSTLQETPNQK